MDDHLADALHYTLAKPYIILKKDATYGEETMQENKPHKFYDFINLNESVVIVKRYNGSVYFKRRDYVTDVRSYPTPDCIYSSKELAQSKVENLNSSRKKCKYTIESASKYFINLYILNTWGDLTIKNKAVSIKSFQADNYDKRYVYLSIEEAVKALKEAYNKNIKTSIQEQANSEIRYKQRLVEMENAFQADIRNEKERELRATTQLQELTQLNFDEIVKPFETQGDKLVKVLYNKPKVENTLTLQKTPF